MRKDVVSTAAIRSMTLLTGTHYRQDTFTAGTLLERVSLLLSTSIYVANDLVFQKMKLLSKQKAGLKKLKRIGNVDLPPEAFYQVLRTGSPKSGGKD